MQRITFLLLLTLLVGQGCTRAPSGEARRLSEDVTLRVWGVVDDYDAYSEFFTQFRQTFPQVTIDFRRFRLEEYEQALLNGFAEDQGPDVFMIHNTWTDGYLTKILPQPSIVQAAQQTVTGTIRKEVTIQVVDVPTLSPRQMRADFADVVAGDTIRSINESGPNDTRANYVDRVVAIPLSVDTLALYYNRDLLNAAGIPTPPETWDQFQEQVRRLVQQDDVGELIQFGAGFGTGENVERASDIISLLMMQNGTVMADDAGNPTFDKIPSDLRELRSEAPGLQALQFYTDFSNPGKDVYTWNLDQQNSLEAFIQGNSAFFLGYSYHLPTIKSRAPKLNLGITEVPQIAGNPEVNYANYWNWTVSRKTESPDLAWLFVNQLTATDQAKAYLERTGRPAARRTLLSDQFEDEDIGVFATQVLTAKSWYRGVDARAAETALMNMIDIIVRGEQEPKRALKIGVDTVAQTLRRR